MRYEALAPFYDRLMGHVEYEAWVSLIDRILSLHVKTKKPAILELGGGTGILGSKLVQRGYNYAGSDYSYSMAGEARGTRKLPFFCADSRCLPVKKTYDLVLFLYDGINYMQNAEDYSRTFHEVARCLKPGGLFLFDITTETNSLNHFSDYLDFEDYGDYCYVRHSYYDEETMLQYNDFTIFKQKSKTSVVFEKFFERHAQKVFPVKFIEEAIPRTQLSVMGIWDGFTTRKYSLKSERIHFLLRKN